jgi:putative ATP-dependent endonuclease of OLD family
LDAYSHKTVASIFDLQPPEEFAAIMASSDASFQQRYAGFEQMLYAEVSAPAQASFVKFLVTNGDWTSALAGQVPADGAPDHARQAAVPPCKTNRNLLMLLFIRVAFELVLESQR